MSHPLLDGLDGLVGAALRERLVAARAAALAAAGGDPAHRLVARVRAVEAAVVAAMRAGVESLVAALPNEAAAPAPRPPLRRAPTPAPEVP
ncbi:hypothetical protein EEDFHM_03854 [Methylorubrum populi]